MIYNLEPVYIDILGTRLHLQPFRIPHTLVYISYSKCQLKWYEKGKDSY